MKMLNNPLYYVKCVAKGICVGLLVLNFNQVISMDKEPVKIQTIDSDEFTIDKKDLDFSKTLTHVFNDIDNSSSNDTVVIPVSTESFMAVLPLNSLVSEIEDLQTQKKQFKQDGLLQDKLSQFQSTVTQLQERKKRLTSYLIDQLNSKQVNSVELLNAINYLDCPLINNSLLKVLVEDLEKKCETPSRVVRQSTHFDSLLQSLATLDMPQELSVLIGQKIVERSLFSKSYHLVKDVLKSRDVEAYAVSFDKKYCAYAENDKVKLIDIKDKKQKAEIVLDIDTVKDLCFSPDGTMLAIVSQLKNKQSVVYVYSLKISENTKKKNNIQAGSNGEESFEFKDSSVINSNILNIVFSPCSQKLLISANNAEFLEWDINNEYDNVFVDPTNRAPCAMTYNKQGAKVKDDPLNRYRKKFGTLFLKYGTLLEELRNLKAEQALLFVHVMKNVVDTGKFNFPTTSYTHACYNYLLQKPVIASVLKELTSKNLKNSSCTIS